MGDKKLGNWTNKWLNDPASLRVLSQPNTISAQSTVSALIDPQTSAWHKELLRQIFFPADVHSILNIPLSVRLPHNRLMWAYTPKGQFTVSSAYKLVVVENLEEGTAGASDDDTQKMFWRRLWGLNLPNKIKSFA